MSFPRPLVLLPLLALLASCSSRLPESSTGSVQLAVSARQALASTNVARVTVTASAADVPAVALELVPTEGVWGGVIGNLPAGEHRAFLAQAFDASGTLRYEGRVEGVTIVAGQLTLVTLTLQSLSSSVPYRNEAPVIDSVVASPLVVAPGGQVALTSRAHDADPGDTLAYAWTAPSGRFAASTAASTRWTAPSTPGPVVLQLTVSDSSGAASSVALQVRVSQGQGGAVVDVSFNSPPTVTAVTSSESNLEVGQQTTLTATAADVDGDVLRYQWSATCAGSFDSNGTATARFTPTAYPSGTCNNCQVSVAVYDGRGGQTTGTRALCVAPAAVQPQQPTIVRTYQSSLTAKPGQQLIFEVVASDPQGSALRFVWDPAQGSLGPIVPGVAGSRATWTAPLCLRGSAVQSVTSTVTNALGLSIARSFVVTGLPQCPSRWALTGSMSGSRIRHTATLLVDGRVLVAGGQGVATAEIYDPASGTWSDTASMSRLRYYHTATRLPDGRVLVVGGNGEGFTQTATAEIYDPSSSTWSATGPMSESRAYHTATLLPDGTVLVAGGTNESYSSRNSAEIYNPASGTWRSTGQMASSRYAHTATLLSNGKVLAAGNPYFADSAEVYDPATGAWTRGPSMQSPRYYHMATLLADGRVLIAGGQGLATAEVYDPVADSWVSVQSMALMHYNNMQSTLLPDGKVLVAGGVDGVKGYHAEAELYDPVTGSWSKTDSMTSARGDYTATRLLNGTVLIAGGGSSWTHAEIYTP